jgi:hypothetical protein
MFGFGCRLAGPAGLGLKWSDYMTINHVPGKYCNFTIDNSWLPFFLFLSSFLRSACFGDCICICYHMYHVDENISCHERNGTFSSQAASTSLPLVSCHVKFACRVNYGNLATSYISFSI